MYSAAFVSNFKTDDAGGREIATTGDEDSVARRMNRDENEIMTIKTVYGIILHVTERNLY